MALINPEYLETKPYTAMRDRLTLAHGGTIQAGVWNSGDFKVTQRALGATMSADVAAGFALVNANDPGNLGLYHIQNDATVNVSFVATEGNPRIDQVVLTINDSTDGGDASDTPVLQVIKGTAISGVTLDAPGASKGAIPSSSLLLADVLVPANSDATGIITANIRDRRPWAKGFRSVLNGTNLNGQTPSGFQKAYGVTDSLIDTSLQGRFECSGNPVHIRLMAGIPVSTALAYPDFVPWIDGAALPNREGINELFFNSSVDQPNSILLDYEWTPAPGSHLIGPAWKINATQGSTPTVTLYSRNDARVQFLVEEILRTNTANT